MGSAVKNGPKGGPFLENGPDLGGSVFYPRYGSVFKGGISIWVRLDRVGLFSKATWVDISREE